MHKGYLLSKIQHHGGFYSKAVRWKNVEMLHSLKNAVWARHGGVDYSYRLAHIYALSLGWDLFKWK